MTTPSPARSRRRFLGGTVALTLALTGIASATAPGASAAGAIQELDWCRASVLPTTDDGSSPEVRLPFPLGFFGEEYSSLWVNNNGNLTFRGKLGTYTPRNLQGASSVPPMIAAFFADVDTRGSGGGTVTYGISPDNTQFCATWNSVGYYAAQTDKTNTFQIILTSRSAVPGRSPGDFDITLNYGKITWEAGNVSGGSGGTGGTTAAAGYTAGTGASGTYFQIDGSLQPGALLDSGPKALISRRQGSSTQGRFMFEIRNDGYSMAIGAMTGRVVDDATGAGLSGVLVDIRSPRSSYWTRTLADGSFSLDSVRVGDYTVRVQTPGNTIARPVSATIREGQTTQAPVIRVRVPAGLPRDGSVTLTNGSWNVTYNDAGIPNLYWTQPINLSVANQCRGGTGTYAITVAGRQIRGGAMLEAPPGTYSVAITPLYPATGHGEITYTITCPSGQSSTVTIDIYIDPSGVVVDVYGAPIPGAVVTLLRSEEYDGNFTAIPSGSELLDPSTRTNPQTTGPDGRFGWDVVTGWYKVQVEVPGAPMVVTAPYQVAPERTALVIPVPGYPGAVPPTPSVPPSFTGILQPEQAVSINTGTWAPDIAVLSVSWIMGGVEIATGPTVSVPPAPGAELGAVISAVRVVEGNVDGVLAADGQPHQFTFPFTYTASAGVISPGTLASTPAPKIAGKIRVGAKLTAKTTGWDPGVTFSYQWLRAGKAISKATKATYTPVAKDRGKRLSVRVTGSKPGFTPVTVKSKATKKVTIGKFTKAPKPKISGTAKVGKKLKVKAGTWKPKPKLSYQWYRNGVKISGATKATYTVSSADRGRKITVKVTAKRSAFTSKSKTSAAKTAA